MNEIICLDNVVWMTQDNWRAVNGISLCIREKEHVMVCGNSASGKDALMRLIAGMVKPSAGTVCVLNQEVQAMSSGETADFRNRNIGVVLNETGFMERLSVAENISLPLAIRGVSRNQQRKSADDLLKMLGLYHLAQAKPSQLSAFEARTACIARALITKPRILLVEEITSRLLEREAEKMIETLCMISEYGEYTMLCFSDDTERFLFTDRTIWLENGKIREDIK